MTPIELERRAQKDARGIDASERRRVLRALEDLDSDVPRENFDVRPLVGHSPWLRLRIGSIRVIFKIEIQDRDQVIVVTRIVARRELARAVRGLRRG